MPTPRTALLASDTMLARCYDVALLDLDGVVYLGANAVAGAPEALREAREVGMRLAFVTNNASRTPDVVAAHLSDLGVPADPGDVTTSAQAAARELAGRLPAGSRVLVVGTVGLRRALAERGLVPVDVDDPDVVAVAQGFSPDLTWHQLCEGAVAIGRGVPWIVSNLDPTVPSSRGRLPGTGSMVAALRHATGAEPAAVAGKPDPTMHRESVERSGARNPLVVGDRLDTDIEGANAAQCASMLVLSGVTSPAELLAAPPELRPGYVAPDVSGLLRRHRAPRPTRSGYACGTWVLEASAGAAWTLRRAPADPGGVGSSTPDDGAGSGAGDGLDALRAACAARWDGAAAGPWHPGDHWAEAELDRLGIG